MILNNNPAIDVDELMKRVRAEAARIRTSGAIEFRRGEPRNQSEVQLAKSLDRHRAVTGFLNEVETANRRMDVPRRLKMLGPIGAFVTRVTNYLFKRQREINAALLHANREMIAIELTVGEALARSIEDLASLERYRTETFREIRSAIDALRGETAGIAHAHHHTRELAVAAEHQARGADGLRDMLNGIEQRLEDAIGKSAFAHERIDSSQDTLQRLSGRLEHVDGETTFAHQRIDSSEAVLRAISDRLEATAQRIEHTSSRMDDSDRSLRAIGDRANDSPTRLEARQSIVDALREVDRRMSEGYESTLRAVATLRGELHAGPRPSSRSLDEVPAGDPDDGLHAILADRFRGTRAEVGERLAVYMPVVRSAGTVTSDFPLLDVGPGRGEWLNALRAEDIPAYGVETNHLMVEECGALGLDVRRAGMLDALRNQPSGSLGAITAFHVVEHLPFTYLIDALREAIRTLVPGGLAIFETPDPRNLLVSTRTFYLDPTHLHPVPHELLLAILEAVGFAECRMIELHAPDVPAFSGADAVSRTLNAYFSHPQDYAIVARAPRA